MRVSGFFMCLNPKPPISFLRALSYAYTLKEAKTPISTYLKPLH